MEPKFKCKVVRLASNQHVNTTIWYHSGDLYYSEPESAFEDWKLYQHLYFVTNEKIEIGDWYISDGILRVILNDDHRNDVLKSKKYSKVVATTYKLIHLPQISPEFIKEYVKSNGLITDVEITSESNDIIIISRNWSNRDMIKIARDAFNAGYDYRSDQKSDVNFEKWFNTNFKFQI